MKTIFLLLANISLFFLTSYARTPRVSNKHYSYETLKLSQLALPKERSYSVNLITAPDYQNRAFYYENNIQIPGWIKSKSATYEINIKLFPVNYLTPVLSSRCEFIKDTTGIIVDTNWFYKTIYNAKASASIEIIDEKNNIVYSNPLAVYCFETSGKEFRTLYEANRQVKYETINLQHLFLDAAIQYFTAQSNKNLDVLLGFYPIRKNNELLIVRNKKHSEYENMQKFWNSFNIKSDGINANTNLSAFESTLKDEINYLKEIEIRYNGNKKADKKMRYIAYLNLAKIYNVLEMPDKEIYFAQKIRNNDFKKYNAPYIIADAQQMKKLHIVHGIRN
jgi:hypothetical protein